MDSFGIWREKKTNRRNNILWFLVSSYSKWTKNLLKKKIELATNGRRKQNEREAVTRRFDSMEAKNQKECCVCLFWANQTKNVSVSLCVFHFVFVLLLPHVYSFTKAIHSGKKISTKCAALFKWLHNVS